MNYKYKIARSLRKNSTKEEQKLWSIVRNRQLNNFKFKRQVPIGNYVVDFLCEAKKLIIEIDGGQHNQIKDIQRDEIRTEFLNQKGYVVIRFWNNEINENIRIFDIGTSPHSSPNRRGRTKYLSF